MDLLDLFWFSAQQKAIDELRSNLGTAHSSSRATVLRQLELIRLMQQENDELRLRVAVLVRLLVQQGTISTDQFTAAINEAKASIAAAQTSAAAKSALSLEPAQPQTGR